jgi:putative ABC transport system ATP-binding protein
VTPSAAPSPSSARLHAADLRFRYAPRAFGLHLRQLTLRDGDILLLSGPSGSGKTTLLRLLSGLLPPDSGTLTFGAAPPLHQQPPSAQRAWRLRHVGLIFQDFALLDYLTAEENALLPARFLQLPPPALLRVRERARSLAERLDLAEPWHRPVTALSQGERQRVAIVRALATSPSCLFADEPTASLDRRRRDQAIALLQEYATETGAPLVLVTHDPDLAARFPLQLNLEDLHA